MTRRPRVVAGFLLSLILPMSPAAAQQAIEGYWEGVIAARGSELRMNVEIANEAGGLRATIDIPDLYVSGYALKNVGYEAPDLHFDLPLGSDPDRFEGRLGGGTKPNEGNSWPRPAAGWLETMTKWLEKHAD
jgi:hypothetical protein